MLALGFTFFSLLAATFASQSAGHGNKSLPVVDLGYELHQAASLVEAGNYYNFSNIRYAAPPLGDLRFSAPQKPAVNRSSVQTGAYGPVCPGAAEIWLTSADEFLQEYLGPDDLIPLGPGPVLDNTTAPTPLLDPRTTEDCLFLDVMVPKPVFESARAEGGSGAPVLVWIHGGGYTGNSKRDYGYSPVGFINQLNESTEGMVFVALNYRLGALGFLAGSVVQDEGVLNAGLLDQRLALEWIQEHIALFGGDPDRVTISGESAGGGSVMFQLTAYGGQNGSVPFQQAIAQSPGYLPRASNKLQEEIYNDFLTLLNVSTLAEARQLPSIDIVRANLIQVGHSTPYGTFTFGPVVDGDFVPDEPGRLLRDGAYDSSVKVFVGHNAHDGIMFTNPNITDDDSFAQAVREILPEADTDIVDHIVGALYPAVFDGSLPYTDQITRLELFTSDYMFNCFSHALSTANNNDTFGYYFTLPPALHGLDLYYAFWSEASPNPIMKNATAAQVLQQLFTSFAATGVPSARGVPALLPYGDVGNVLNLNNSSITLDVDPAANERCAWWIAAPYAK